MIPKLTYAGQEAMLRALDGDEIHFTKIKMGNGQRPEDYQVLTDLQNPMKTLDIDQAVIEDHYAKLTAETVTNSDFESDFFWTELGVFVSDPDGGEDDLLYAYAHYEISEDAAALYIGSSSSSVLQITPIVHVYIGDAENITAELSEATEYALKTELNAHASDTSNPHGVTKTQVGLSNVPNVTTNNQTPTYSRPSLLKALTSGETLATALGKIATAVDNLISHISNHTMHITSGERTSWNSKANGTHTHSATDINTGTLSITRGGTGATTPTAARKALGIQSGVNFIDGNVAGTTKTITFPSAFAGAPMTVLLQPHNLAEGQGNTGFSLEVISITATQFTVRCYSVASVSINFGWVAVL